jgi:hypothetical protein
MRLLRIIVEAGLETPERQIEVYDADGAYIGCIDLGWRNRRGVRRFGLRHSLEYDSDRFHNPRAWARDESGQQRYAAAGWDVRRVGKLDLLPSVTWLRELLRRMARGQRVAA